MSYINKYNFGEFNPVWDPWVGCYKISEACDNCYVKPCNTFKNNYKPFNLQNSPAGTVIAVCLHSDFFLTEADRLRQRAWNIIRRNRDLIFIIITKRIDRIQKCLPYDWREGYENVILCATIENQKRANERLPVFLSIPAKHRWVTCSPMLEQIDLSKYLATGKIEHVECTGERCCDKETTIRPTKYEWVKDLAEQCKKAEVRFTMQYLGYNFLMTDGEVLHDWSKWCRSEAAEKLGLNFYKPITFNLSNSTITY